MGDKTIGDITAVIITTVVLTGCCPEVYRVQAWEIASMMQQCAEKGGLEYITTIGAGRCMDGSYVHGKR